MLQQIEGSKAVAETIAACMPDVVCAYPISPQTHIVEALDELMGRLEDGLARLSAAVSDLSQALAASPSFKASASL